MRYLINRENYHRFDVMEVNKLAPRSYFIPFKTRLQADAPSILEKRYASPKVSCLNGKWDFKFYPQPALVPQELDTDAMKFDTIDVPACWQLRGYDRPFYVNTRYQFPFDPPRIPREDPVGKTFCWVGADQGVKPRWITPDNEYNFVGVYRHKIRITNPKKRHIISFLGVASCLDLYVNGVFAGYSEGSHNTAEFDISILLQEGENELLAVVHRWCTGTYLECQDMFRHTGIFRDVLLYEMDEKDIWDLKFSTTRRNGAFSATTRVNVTGAGKVTVTLRGHGLERCETVIAENGEASVTFNGLDVIRWNAEAPVLYDLYVEYAGTCVRERVGFKTVEINGTVLTFNGSPIKFKGVNHHDTSSTNGYYLTPEEIQRDVMLCKAHNMNTIRTSHYPPDPLLLEVCDELGIYVVDEADLETHGTFSQQLPPTYNTISHDPKWENRYLDRVRRLFIRDRNHPSIFMWSLGNEAGGYRNTDAMYAWLKERTALPVHYESAIHSKRVAYDVGSEMYPSVENVRLVGQRKRREKQLNDRPYFLCEYAHAMGVGPGAMEEYWDQIYRFDNLMGGCIWEMVDHAIVHADGTYTYGGDHGEWEHDGNFCCDGLFYPDRTPSTGARIAKFVYRPLRVRHVEGNRYEIFNTLAFTDADVFRLNFRFSGGAAHSVKISVPPMQKRILSLPDGEAAVEYVTVTVTRDGREISKEQIVFNIPVITDVKTHRALNADLSLCDGVISYQKDGKWLTACTPYTVLFRAATDNDYNFMNMNTMEPYIDQFQQVVETKVEGGKLTVVTKISNKRQEFLCTDIYESCDRGILLTSRLHCTKGGGNLPRFGKAFRLEADFDRVEYVGRNDESYVDMKHHAQIERVVCNVADMTEPNLRPQESGNRCDCTFARVSDGETEFSFTAVGKPFELGIKPYSDVELLTMKHRQDEVVSGTYVTVSAFQMGIGTGICGPATRKEYCYSAREDHELKFIIG